MGQADLIAPLSVFLENFLGCSLLFPGAWCRVESRDDSSAATAGLGGNVGKCGGSPVHHTGVLCGGELISTG